MKSDTVSFIDKYGIIAIARGFETDELTASAKALSMGGVKLIEVPFVVGAFDKTLEQIKALRDSLSSEMKIGAGTVLTPKQVELAHASGAEYIVSPNVNAEVIKKTNELGMVSIPGAYTPSEIQMAHELGADYVKVFPAEVDYLRLVSVPLAHIKLLAVGGVDVNTFASYLDAGAVGACIGGKLLDKDLIQKGNFSLIKENANRFYNIFKETKI